MIKKIGVGVLAIVAIILLMAVMKPDSFSVKRSATIKAPPEKIVALVGNFHQWQSWSPWEHIDPNMQRTFSGAPSGAGAVYNWQGNSDVGSGRMEIVEVAAPSKVVIKLNFMDPIEMHNTTEFSLVPQGAQTAVTWHMTGPMPFLSKIISVFMSMDAMVGRDFEKGLANLKAVAEK